MTQVRIIPAVLSAAIVLVSFGYLAVGRAHTTDAPAVRAAPVRVEFLGCTHVDGWRGCLLKTE
jgi:hypothetical protein